MPDSSGSGNAIHGTTEKGVPFIALPPEGAGHGVVFAWHGGDPPRSEAALAAAIPMRDVPAWRVYLNLPLFGPRMPEGGMEEVIRRQAADPLTLLYHPIITGAVDELPDAVEELRQRLSINPALPLALFGFSMGGAAALLTAARRTLPLRAVATFGAVVDIAPLVEFTAAFFGKSYEWTDVRRDLAREISVAHRRDDLIRSGANLMLAVGSDDPYPVPGPAQKLISDIRAASGAIETQTLPGVPHALADEPGLEPAPQGPAAMAVDRVVSGFLRRALD